MLNLPHSSLSRGSGERPGLVLPLAIGAALLLFGPTLALTFCSDDLLVVWRAHRGESGPAGFFRPLSEASIALCHTLFGTAPAGYRIFNVVLHGACAALVVLLSQRLGTRRSTAVLAGTLFLCYPFHHEAILWVVGRGASLATAFTLLFLLALTSGKRNATVCALTSACLFLGLLAYESAFLMPLLALPVLLWLHPHRRSLPALLGAWSATVVLYLAMRLPRTGSLFGGYGEGVLRIAAGSWPTNVPKVLGRLILPPLDGALLATALFLLVSTATAVLVYRSRHALARDPDARAVLFTLATMLLVACSLGFVAGVSTRTSESDRFLYMPAAFLCPLLAFAVTRIADRPWRIATSLLLITACCLGSIRSMRNWALASGIVDHVVATLPPPPPHGRLFASGIPGDVHGAFVLRNGFAEALLLAGRDTARIVQAEPITLNGTPYAISRQGDTLLIGDSDVLFRYRYPQ